jgi:hypothetical protein
MNEQSAKRCPGCCPPGAVLDTAAFARNRARADGLQTHCRECRRDLDARRYDGHGEAMRQQSARAKARRANAARALYFDFLLAHPCPCGERDPVVLEFHHTRSKRAELSKLLMDGASWDRICAELARGEVLCANCHRRAEAAKRHDWRIRLSERESGSSAPAG